MLEWFATIIFQNQWKPSIKSQGEQVVINTTLEVYCTMEWMIAGEWFGSLLCCCFIFLFRLLLLRRLFLIIYKYLTGVYFEQFGEQKIAVLKFTGWIDKKEYFRLSSGDFALGFVVLGVPTASDFLEAVCIQMVEYCEGSGCRRKKILESFGEQVIKIYINGHP